MKYKTLIPGRTVQSAILHWPIVAPTPPGKLSVYTHVEMTWDIRNAIGSGSKDPPRSGHYRFWLEGIVVPEDYLNFNLFPQHASHIGLNPRKVAPWPSFKTKAELNKYVGESIKLKDTVGRLTVRLTFRGYPSKAAETFNPVLRPEQGGPFEVPGKIGATFRAPNRLKSPFRALAPWLDGPPAIWKDKPSWSYQIVLSLSWDGSREPPVFLYRAEYPDKVESGNARVFKEAPNKP